MSLKHIGTRLLVSNFRESFVFYRDILGFTPSFGDENDVYADFDANGVPLALFQRELMAQAVGTADHPVPATADQDRFALIFTVEDVDKTYRRLQSKGVRFVTEPQDRPEWGIRTAHFRDPDGYLLEINCAIRS